MTKPITGEDRIVRPAGSDRESMRLIFETHQQRVYSVALNFFGGNEARAADVVQQVFLKILTRGEAFRGEAAFTTWVYRVTVNTCIDETRKLHRFFSLSELFPGTAASSRSQAEHLESTELANEVQRALRTLKPKYRMPILLKYVEGLSYYEIAEVLDCTVGTVSSRIHRGHKLLAEKLAHLKRV